ncbi:AlpA family transcriptional regulator [Shewanella sp. KX20019]|uniref:helix-turn-helix transcriptional regulator n=1 Tax=Shewanella sp. KX20019 TaxID=2803864 RepID=UPI0019294F7A|nr:AlpA family transcriptional regulator [Shewanella sp. KX20019]QQX81682.1 AlpA family transcriptional regulator [Shewanella sp. KX20019]
MSKKLMRLPEVKQRVGLCRSSIYSRISKGEFPTSISLGDRAVGWLESDIEQWLDERIAASKVANDE